MIEARVENKGTHVFISAAGSLTLKDATETVSSLFTTLKDLKIPKILVDARSVLWECSFWDRYHLNSHIASANITYLSGGESVPVQIVVVADSSILDPQRFGDRVARNLGVNIMSTDNIEEACTWLGVPLPESDASPV